MKNATGTQFSLRGAISLVMTLLLALCLSTAALAEAPFASQAQPIVLDSSAEAVISEPGGYAYYSFVPEVSGAYSFFSTGDQDTLGYLYDSNGSQLAYDDDGGTNNNFKISYQFEAGKQYYFGAKFYNNDTVTGNFTVHLESFHGLISATTEDGSTYSNIEVTLNETAAMTVYATYTEGDSVHYAWYDYGYNLIEGANEATYTSEPVTGPCNYSCTVSDDYGNAQTVYFNIRIDNALTVEGGYNTRVVTVQPHGTATLSVVASCRNGGLSYTWRDNNENTLDSTSETLTLEDVSARASYSCEVKDEYGNSATAWFDVQIDNELEVERIGDGTVTVEPHGSATLTVAASCLDGGVTYTWRDNSWNILDSTSETLTLEDVSARASYSCEVKDEYGNSATAWFDVQIDNALVIEGSGNSKTITVQPHGSATLTVEASCRDGELSYTWWDNKGNTLDSTSETLVLEDVSARASYSCEVKDEYGNSARVWFNVWVDNALRLVGSGNSKTITVQPHGSATLTVEASCRDGELSYTWWDNWGNTLDSTSETLVLEDVSIASYYSCVVEDEYGNSARAWFDVRVDNAFKLEGSGRLKTITVQPHGSVTLTVEASCRDGGLTYTWRDNNWNTLDSTTDTLILENIISTEYYSCTVVDQYGNGAEARFQIRVDNAFSVENRYNTQYIYVPYGETTTLNIVASCREGDLSYQWYGNDGLLENETLSNLVIPAVTTMEDYYCEVTDQYGNEATVNFRVGVENGFYAYAVGGTDRYLPENAVTTLAVQAGCTSGELSFEWYRDQTGQVLGTTDTITSAPVTMGYDFYRCRVSDQYGNFKEIYYTLHMDNELRAWAVSENPVHLSKKSDVTMTVGAECKTGDLTYEWGRMEKNADRNYTYLATVSGPDGATFTARDVDSACYYYCSVIDQYNNRSYVYFDIVWNNNFSAPALNPLRLVNPGDTVTLATNVTCTSGNLSYQWVEFPIEGGSDHFDVISTERALTVSCDQSKTYRCFVQDEYGNGTDYTFIMLVKQSTEPIALNQPTDVATTADLQGKAFTFTPAVTGSYQFSGEGNTPLCAAIISDDGVQWYYTGVTQYGGFAHFMKLEAGRTYTYYAMSTVSNSSFEVYLELLDAEVHHAENQLILPAGTKRIEEGAFAGIGAEEVVLPDGCEYISAGAFADCPNLRLINIPDSVTFIADSAFAGCNVSLIQDGRSNYARQYAVNHGLGWIVPEN